MKQFCNLQKREQKIRVIQIIALICFSTVLFGCATTAGSSIITGKTRPAISLGEVKIYIDSPAQYETIGIVEAASEMGSSRQSTQDKVIKELKLQAAKIGANGVFLTNTGSQSGGTTGIYSNGFYYGGTSDKITAQGKAIYVIQE
jgi:hypothetical protein